MEPVFVFVFPEGAFRRGMHGDVGLFCVLWWAVSLRSFYPFTCESMFLWENYLEVRVGTTFCLAAGVRVVCICLRYCC